MLPETVTAEEVHALYQDVRAWRGERSVHEWAAAPLADRETTAPVAHLLQVMARALGEAEGCGTYLALYGLRLALQEGWTRFAPGFCLAPLALVDVGEAAGLADALAWGDLALALWERPDLRDGNPEAVLLFVLCLGHFRHAFGETVERLEEFSRVARMGGQEPLALVHAPAALVARLLASEPLEPLLQRTDERLDEAATKRVAASTRALGHLSTVLRRWRALPVSDAPANRAGSADDRWLAAYLDGWDALLFGDRGDQDRWKVPEDLPHRLAILEPELVFLEAVGWTRPDLSSDGGVWGERLADLRHRLQVWADACPANYRAKALLVDALETARRDGAAAHLFRQAIDAAEAAGSTLVAAFSHEEAARADQAAGRAWEALPHLLAAFRLYSRWASPPKPKR